MNQMEKDDLAQVNEISDMVKNKLDNSKIGSYQLLTYMRDHSLTRYANNVIHQNVDSKSIWSKIYAAQGKKIVSFTTSPQSDSIDETIERLDTLLNSSPEVPFFKGFIGEQTYKSINSVGKRLNEEERAEWVDRAVDIALDKDPRLKLFGKVETLGFHYSVINSNGLNGSHSITYNDFKVMAIAQENNNRGYGREVEASRNPSKIDLDKYTNSASQIAIDTLNAKNVDPEDYETILRPQATMDLLRYTVSALESSSYHLGNSAFSDRLGEQLFSENFNVYDQPTNEDSIISSPFDSEGVPRQDRTIINKGTPEVIFYDNMKANEFLDDKISNGYGILPYSEYLWGGPDAMALGLETGNSNEEKMIEETDKGLLVQTFWYLNTVNSNKGIITGLTRDGLYLVENGEIKHAVRNLRFTDSYLSFFKNIDSIGGKSTQLMEDHNGSTNVPTTKLESLRFVSKGKH